MTFNTSNIAETMEMGTVESLNIVEGNGLAVLQLLEGSIPEGVTLWHRTLDKARGIMTNTGTSVSGQYEELDQQQLHQQSGQGIHAQGGRAIIHPISLEGVVLEYGDPSATRAPDNFFRMYRVIFSIDGDDSLQQDLTSEATLVSIYNLAVVYQELGFTSSDDTLIERAMRFYELATSALAQIREVTPSSLTVDFTLMEMAILNNLGHAYSFFYKYEKIVSVREALRSALERAQNARRSTDAVHENNNNDKLGNCIDVPGDDMDDDDESEYSYDFFRSSLFLSFTKDEGVAPAA